MAGSSKPPRQMRLTAEHVALLPAMIEDPGPMPFEGGVPTPDSYYEVAVRNLLAAAPPGSDVWLFAFGSLIWNKRFAYVEERTGIVRGWHRDFCLGPDTRYRGNPGAPGYMLSLDRGGQCKGMVYRLANETLAANLQGLLRKEPPFPPTWVTAVTSDGPVRAFAFTSHRNQPGYAPNLSDEDLADLLAKAVGKFGSMAQYVHSTVEQLETLGLCDRRLWRIQQLVAERIEVAHPGSIGAPKP